MKHYIDWNANKKKEKSWEKYDFSYKKNFRVGFDDWKTLFDLFSGFLHESLEIDFDSLQLSVSSSIHFVAKIIVKTRTIFLFSLENI